MAYLMVWEVLRPKPVTAGRDPATHAAPGADDAMSGTLMVAQRGMDARVEPARDA